ncbi:hypothetical protein [Actinomadura sp. NTSP31]|uniref:hypothetical protein n=1 Tax=Actinomadura sp. NTSP31 TaxID=1735447 RepID=UPI0035C24B1B
MKMSSQPDNLILLDNSTIFADFENDFPEGVRETGIDRRPATVIGASDGTFTHFLFP